MATTATRPKPIDAGAPTPVRGRVGRDKTAAEAKGKAGKRPAKAPMAPGKGSELVGLVLGLLGLLLALALLSYHAGDPSLLHQASGPQPEVRNWIGRVGAHVSAVAFGLFGLTALAVPILLLTAGYRRLRGRQFAVVGRGLGALGLLIALPGLLHLAFGRLDWRGGDLEAGGFFGRLLSDALTAALNVPGAALVLIAAVLICLALVVQSTLGEVLADWKLRIGNSWQAFRMKRALRKEQRQKDKVRRRVVESHVAEARAGKERRSPTIREAEPLEPVPPPPLRVVERKGEGSFRIRRVQGEIPGEVSGETGRGHDLPLQSAQAPAAAAPASPAALPPMARDERPAAAKPQAPLPFPTPAAVKGALPPINLLRLDTPISDVDQAELFRRAEAIRERCGEFGVEGSVDGVSPGPVITTYEFQPAPGVKVSQIVNLQDDLALALKAESVRIDRLAGRSTLGMEVPNAKRQIIRLGTLLSRPEFQRAPSPLTMALGVDIHGEPYYGDLATMPHLLVAGATGAGKSVGLQSMITSIIYKSLPENVQFIFIDPKRIELGVYADLPCLRTPVVVEPKQAANVLNHMVAEMEERYRKLAKVHVRSIAHYNQAIRDPEQRKKLALNEGEGDLDEADFQPLPFIVIIIDELADLMMVASSEVETAIARLAQMARAVGIHLIVATQRPSVDVLTGTIKANFPCRIAYATATRHDSRTILDQIGAERLLGKGDMLFMPPGTSRVMRLHGGYVTEQETAALVRWLKKQGAPQYDLNLLEPIEGKRGTSGGGGDDGGDPLFDEAARLVVSEGMASASFLQRRMRVGFSRASRLIDMMEQDGLLGPPQGSKPRDVLVGVDYFGEIDRARVDE
jgi:S-DNA-T family DNA segregation ATPase FtsK/SpoIIIE